MMKCYFIAKRFNENKKNTIVNYFPMQKVTSKLYSIHRTNRGTADGRNVWKHTLWKEGKGNFQLQIENYELRFLKKNIVFWFN